MLHNSNSPQHKLCTYSHLPRAPMSHMPNSPEHRHKQASLKSTVLAVSLTLAVASLLGIADAVHTACPRHNFSQGPPSQQPGEQLPARRLSVLTTGTLRIQPCDGFVAHRVSLVHGLLLAYLTSRTFVLDTRFSTGCQCQALQNLAGFIPPSNQPTQLLQNPLDNQEASASIPSQIPSSTGHLPQPAHFAGGCYDKDHFDRHLSYLPLQVLHDDPSSPLQYSKLITANRSDADLVAVLLHNLSATDHVHLQCAHLTLLPNKYLIDNEDLISHILQALRPSQHLQHLIDLVQNKLSQQTTASPQRTFNFLYHGYDAAPLHLPCMDLPGSCPTTAPRLPLSLRYQLHEKGITPTSPLVISSLSGMVTNQSQFHRDEAQLKGALERSGYRLVTPLLVLKEVLDEVAARADDGSRNPGRQRTEPLSEPLTEQGSGDGTAESSDTRDGDLSRDPNSELNRPFNRAPNRDPDTAGGVGQRRCPSGARRELGDCGVGAHQPSGDTCGVSQAVSEYLLGAVEYHLARGAGKFLGNAAALFSAAQVVERRHQGLWASYCSSEGVDEPGAGGGGVLLVDRLPWVFTYNSWSGGYDYMLEGAVESAVKVARLRPYCLFSGDTSSPVVHYLRAQNATLMSHTPAWREELLRVARPFMEDNAVHSHLYGSEDMLLGTFLRVDIPLLSELQQYSYVLYTDVDVVFTRHLSLPDFPQPLPKSIAMASEIMDVFPYNAGIMLMNVAAMRKTYRPFLTFLMGNQKGLYFEGYGPGDQGAYNQFYESTAKAFKLPQTFNSKPYLPPEDGVFIIHFHGPKPDDYLKYQEAGECRFSDMCKEGFEAALCTYVEAWVRNTPRQRTALSLHEACRNATAALGASANGTST